MLINSYIHSGETLGSEEVTNGDFSSDTVWTKNGGSTISGGIGNLIASGGIDLTGSNWSFWQETGMLEDGSTTYKLVMDVRQTGGSGNFQAGRGFEISFDQAVTGSWVTYEATLTATSSTNGSRCTFGGATAADTFEVDNISIKEIL